MSVFRGETPGRVLLMYIGLAAVVAALFGPAAAYLATENKAWFAVYTLYLAAGLAYAWKRTEE